MQNANINRNICADNISGLALKGADYGTNPAAKCYTAHSKRQCDSAAALNAADTSAAVVLSR